MSKKKKIATAAGVLGAVILVALGIYKVFFAPKGHTQDLTDAPLTGAVVADYTKDESARTETFASGSKGYSWENGDPFNVWWKAENAVYDAGKLTLKLSEMTQKEQVWGSDGTASDCLSEYYGAEVRSEHYYGYGDFQVRMKPAAIPGTASTFFTCTGPYDVWYNPDGSVQRANDHDEIDIEFLGKDTTKVQFNYFASGKGGHEYMYDLGFDASKDFHNYGYRWSEESITWFVDDKPVYKVLRSEIPAGEDWPEDPGRIVMNYWCGTANAALWMGTFQDDYTSGAEYEWVSSSAAAQPDPSSTKPATAGQPADQPGGELGSQLPDTQWAPVDLSAFDGWGKYTVANSGDKVTVSHDKKLQKYDCCGMDLVLGSRNKVSYTVTNTGKEKAYAKVSIKSTAVDQSAIVSATINGKDAGYIEYGVLCELAPGESADVVMLLDLGQKPTQMVVSLNSEADSEGKALRSDMPSSGTIVISRLQAVKSDETALPGAGQSAAETQPSGGPKAPEGPVTQWAELDLSAFDGWGKYTVTNAGGKITVSHGKKLQKYDCCGTDLALGGRNKVSYTVTNTGKEKAYTKVSVKNTSGDRSAITSATINGKDAGYYEYGVLCELAPGESAQVVMLLDLGQKPTQMVVSLNSEADSEGKALRSDMPATGTIVISQLKAVKSGENVLPGAAAQTQQGAQSQQGPQAPDIPVDQLAMLDLSSFEGWGKYTVSKAEGAITVSHDKTMVMYDCCGSDIALGERNKVQLTLTNSGEAKAFAKVNVKDRTDSSGKSSILCATVNGVTVDYVEYGVLCELAPGQSAQVEIYVDGVHPADQLVLSLNSEADSEGKALRGDMPGAGSVILSNVQAVKTDKLPAAPEQPGQKEQTPQKPAVPDTQWADVDLSAMDGWGKYTVARTEGGVTVSHDKAVAMYDCCGGEVALGSRNKVKLTLTNEGKEKAFAKVNINDKTITTGISSIQAATVNGVDAGYIEYGVLCELPAGQSAQVELLLAPGKAADQLVISLNSEGDSEGKALRGDMPKAGKVTLSGLQAVKTDETALAGTAPEKKPVADVPLTQWADVDLSAFDGWGMYTVEKTADSVTMSHDKALRQYACAGMNYDAGERNKVRMTIKNNGTKTAEAKVSIKSDKVDTSAILGATIDGKAVSDATYGVMCKVPAGKSVELVLFLDLKKDIKQFVVSLNSEKARGGPTSGSVTVSGLQAMQSDEKFTKATGGSSGGGGGGGDGGYTPPPPAVPGMDGKLTLNPSSGTGWNSTSTATAVEGGGVKLSHSSAQGLYGNYSWPISMGGNNRMELDIVNDRNDVKAYAKVSLTTEGDNSGRSVLESATVEKTAGAAPALFRRMSPALPSPMAVLSRAGGAVAVQDVEYGVLCELEPGESAHVVLVVRQDKLSQANKLVVSLNSEGNEAGTALSGDMPAAGSVTLKNIVCGQTETPGPGPSFTDPTTAWDLALQDWSNGKYTVSNTTGTVQLSHTGAVDNWACAGKDGLDFGDAESLMFTLTNNHATNEAKFQFKVVRKETNVCAMKSATVAVDGGDPAELSGVTADGAIFTLAAGKSAVVRISLDPEKHADQVVVFLNSMQAAGATDLAQAGDVTISETKWDKENDTPVDPDPGPEPGGDGVMMGQTKLTFTTSNDYDIAYAEDNSAMTVSYANVKYLTYWNINAEIENIVAVGDTLTFKVTNDNDAAVKLTTKIQGASDSETIYDGTVMVAKGTQEIQIAVEDKGYTPKGLYLFIDSGWNESADETQRSGKLTFSDFSLTKAETEEPGDGVMMGEHKLTFEKNDVYTVSYAQGNTAMTVSYTAVKYNTYQNVNTGIEALVAVGDTLAFKVTNNGDDAVKLTTKVEGANSSETVYDNTVMVAKGSQDISVKVENTSYTPTKLFFFVDSGWDSNQSDETQRSGELIFSDFILTKAGGDEPEQGGDGVLMGGNKLVFDKNDEYTVSYAKSNAAMTVTYTGVKHQTYINVNTSIKDTVGIGDTLKFAVKNNKDAAVKLGVKIEGATQSDVVYDQTVDIAGNEEKEITIGIEGTIAPEKLFFFIDSGWDSDTETEHSGNLTFSGFSLTSTAAAAEGISLFSVEPVAEPAGDPEPQPAEPPVAEEVTEEEEKTGEEDLPQADPPAAPPAEDPAEEEEAAEAPAGTGEPEDRKEPEELPAQPVTDEKEDADSSDPDKEEALPGTEADGEEGQDTLTEE